MFEKIKKSRAGDNQLAQTAARPESHHGDGTDCTVERGGWVKRLSEDG
jgi:hypothetical protein